MNHHSSPIAFALIFLIALGCSGVFVINADPVRDNGFEEIALIKGAHWSNAPSLTVERIVRAKIHPTLPLYKLRLIANHRTNSMRIEVSRAGTPGTIQVLRHSDWLPFGSNTHLAMKQSLVLEDLNFDGYLDIRALDSFGVRILSYRCWTFDPRRERFVYSKDLTNITEGCEFKLNAKRKEILTVKDCENTTGRIEETYRLSQGKFVLVRKRTLR